MTLQKNIESIIIPPPKARLKAPLSIVQGVSNNNIVTITTFGNQMERMIKNESLKEQTEKARSLKDSDKIEYKIIKEKAFGFISGKWKIRNDNSNEIYSPLMFFDIDGLADIGIVELLLESCKIVPEIFTAFPSFGGCGLRIGIWTESTLETHKKVYKAICSYLNEELPINYKEGQKIDTSTSNPSRLFFENHVAEEHFYLNIDSEIFAIPSIEEKTFLKTTEKTAIPKTQNSIDEKEKIRLCKLAVEKANGIARGRNNFVFAFACKMWEHGLNEQIVLSECLSFEDEDFSKAEINKTVKSAIKKATFQRFTDAQLLKYREKIEGTSNTQPSPSQPPSSKKEEKEKEKITFRGDNKFLKIEHFLEDNYTLRRNIISHDIEYEKTDGTFEIFNENDLEIRLLRGGLTGIKEPVSALLGSSNVEDFNPFKHYFENLPNWKESDPDYITQLADHVDAADQEWFNLQFKKMLVRSIACALGFISFNKQCFTLVGKQNDGKTSFLRFLCPPILSAYIKDNPFFGNKDGLLTLVQNLFINLDELANISKYDINQIKKIFTMDCVKERLPYARKPETFVRRASFLGSTNNGEFLTDPTGNVRWLVFDINGIHHDNGGKNGYNQNINIDKVWSQAYGLLKSGFEYRMTKEDIKKSEENNRNFQVTTLEAELIQERFIPASKDDKDAIFMMTNEIHKIIDAKTNAKITPLSIGRAMTELRFKRSQKFFKEIEGKIVNQQRKGFYVIDLNPNFL
jgi:hypothetical protein